MLSVKDLAELRGVTLAMRTAPRDLRNAINRQLRANLNPIWREELASKVSRLPEPDRTILGKGARVKVGNSSQFVGATSTRPLSGGLVPTRRAKGFEFGTDDREGYKTYTRRSRNGGTHRVTRRTKRQMPARRAQGWAIWPAASEALPRVVSLQVQTIVRLLNEKLGN